MERNINLLKKTGLSILIIVFVFVLGILFSKVTSFFPEKVNSKVTVAISQLRELKRLEVLQANIFSYKTYNNDAYLNINKNEFVVFAQGKAIYGIDFSKNFEVKVNDKDVEVILPKIKIFDVIVNPDGIEFVGVQKGLLTSQQRFEDLKRDAQIDLYQQIRFKAQNDSIYQQAQKNAENIIISILKGLGFDKITIKYKDENVNKG